jgi:hypothetical protein
MPDSDGMTDRNGTSIPQIVLTEPPSQTVQEEEATPIQISIPSTSNNTSPINTNPLPLTKDILQRKNKLDKLLFQKERYHSTEYFSSNPVDERVTAGLGISTPNDNKLTYRRLSSNRHSHRNDTEKSKSEWSYDLDAFKSITTDSSKGHNKQSGAATSVSGSSNRNSVSMRAYSANHRYMDNHHYNIKQNEANRYTRPEQQNQCLVETKSKYQWIDLLYQAVVRVINSRAPESKSIRNLDFHTTTNNSTTSLIAPIKVSIEQSSPIASIPPNEKLDLITTPTSNNNNNNHRFSWLSFTNSIDENKSFYDNESFNLEKKLSTIVDSPQKGSPSSPRLPPTSPPPPPPPVAPMIPKQDSSSSLLLTNPLQGNSMYLFSPHNPFRIFIWKFIRKR